MLFAAVLNLALDQLSKKKNDLYIFYLAGGTTSNNLLQRETAIAHLERLEPGIIFIT